LATYAAGVPTDAAIFGPDGSVYVADYTHNQIQHYDAAGILLGSFGAGHMTTPRNLAFTPGGNLLVTSATDDTQAFSSTGAYLGLFADGAIAGMSGIRGITIGPDGNLYETDFGHSRVYRFNGTTGAFMDIFATGSG